MSLTPSEAQELRALQTQAYARGGGLSAPDVERMQELEELRSETPHRLGDEMERAPELTTAERTPAADPSPHESPPPPVAPDIGGPGAEILDEGGRPRGRARRRGAVLVGAAALALLGIGIGAAWMLFGRPSGGLPLTGAQAERRVELDSGGSFDEGSLRAIAADDEILVWFATRNERASACVILDVPGAEDEVQSSQSCLSLEEVQRQGLAVGLLSSAHETERESIQAEVLITAAGEPAAAVHRWPMGPAGWLDQYQGEDRKAADALVAQGFEPSLIMLVGRLQGQPVWTAVRTEQGGEATVCLVVLAGAAGATECRPQDAALAEGLNAAVLPGDGTAWSLELRYTPWQQPYLSVTRGEGALATVEQGDRLEIGGEYGDPIEVTSEPLQDTP